MNVYIWGTGKVAKEFIDKAKLKQGIQIAGFDEECMLIIASSFTDEILKTILFETNLKMSQCVALRPTKFSNALDVNMKNIWKIVDNPVPFVEDKNREIKILRTGTDYTKDCLWDLLPKPRELSWRYDYVRINTFELVADEIEKKNLDGAVAELGVYRGDFAQYINFKFKDRKLYLFDTFQGFNENESRTQIEMGYADQQFADSFKDTSETLVLSKMTYPEQCIIKKGLFPESLDGLEEKFAFVSIDVDYEDSIFEGMRYFYPRLVSGGYIFIHDYNDIWLGGVKKAVERYERQFGELKKVPIADGSGTLVIVK